MLVCNMNAGGKRKQIGLIKTGIIHTRARQKKENSLNKTNGKANEPTNEQVKQTKERTQTNSESKQVSLSQLKGIKRNENSR